MTWSIRLGVLLVVFVSIARTPVALAEEKRQGEAVASPAAGSFDFLSKAGGKWSDPATWQQGKQPTDGSRVLISAGDRVEYDVDAATPIRELHVAGTLSFARDRNTKLVVGLLRVGRVGADAAETGVEDIDKHGHDKSASKSHGHGDSHGSPGAGDPNDGPALEVGTPDAPIPVPYTARIQLKYFDGMDATKLPAILCRPGGRMDFHGAPLKRTWLKLGGTPNDKDAKVLLAERPEGWRAGDMVIVTGSERRGRQVKGEYETHSDTEQRVVVEVEGRFLTLDKPLKFVHFGTGDFRSEVANLTRTVIVESTDAKDAKTRGHTMYHHGSLGSISYALFNHLGKEAVLGRYPIHFHQVEDTMRGSSVVGAVVLNSGNRWVTVHGTQYMVVRDCIGWNSVGHGYFLEDGTEVYNTFDRNLGIRAGQGKRMKGQALPFDPNDGAAFWWANGKNTFIRNVACENEEYGYRYDSQGSKYFSAEMMIRQPDGSLAKTDIRKLPHYRFQQNESHTEGLYGFVFADTDGVGPDTRHPHILRDTLLWETHYGLRAQIPTMLVENLRIHRVAYGVYRPWFDNHVYRNVHMSRMSTEPFNRGQDDDSAQAGKITVDGLTFSEVGYGGEMPLIQMSDNNLSGTAESHFRNVKVERTEPKQDTERRWPLVNRGGGSRVEAKTAKGVPVYMHDYFGAGKSAKVVLATAPDLKEQQGDYKKVAGLTGREAVAAEVTGVQFPQLLDPVDDQPPATMITSPARGHVARIVDGKLTIRGTTTDNTATRRVLVNGVEAKDVDFNFHQWEVTLTGVKPGPITIEALAEDAAGNREQTPHRIVVTAR